MKLVVIGAGAAGLCAAKYGIDFGYEVTVFEQTDRIGGTWNYTDEVGKDKHGLDVHTSMYQGLLTNLPKEVMAYPTTPFPEGDVSYATSAEVLKYYQSYAAEFDLTQYVKFEHYVLRVRPLIDKSWEVIVQDMKLNNCSTYIFDAVLVCNGHYNSPRMPAFKGQDIYEGKQMHSHDFRSAEKFRGERVLIIGAGPSGRDAVKDCSKFAQHVTWSHHLNQPPVDDSTNNLSQKPDVKEFTRNGVKFIDGSYQEFTVIIFCTGYKYSFPFLSVDCGIRCDNNYVRPLYKHCISINNPSLGFIGLPHYVCPNQISDLQVRFFLTYMTGRKELPSKEEMLQDLKRDVNLRRDCGFSKQKAHYLFQEGFHDEYLAQLAAEAELVPIKPVVLQIFKKALFFLFEGSPTFRKNVFKIIDDENFILLKK